MSTPIKRIDDSRLEEKRVSSSKGGRTESGCGRETTGGLTLFVEQSEKI